MKILFLVAVLLFFLFALTPRSVSEKTVSGSGPGYIPAFQGHPQIGSRI
jgi:hypothetical protein